MQTYRCQHCGQVLAAFVSFAPGLALPFSNQAAQTQVQARREQHAERCPAAGKRGRRTAVVIGASMAGLLTARVLSETYDHVRIIDRDRLPDEIRPRGGVPQGAHTHGLLARGREVLDELFPGLVEDLVSAGALAGDLQADVRWNIGGGDLKRGTSGLEGIMLGRPMLEHHVRERVAALPNVTIAQGLRATGLTCRGGRVRGVMVANGSAERPVAAELVVDASGRTSRLPDWLGELGYEEPEVERVQVDVSYTTRTFARTPTDLGGQNGLIVAATPEAPVGAAMLRQENERWIVSIGAYHGDVAPRELPAFAERAAEVDDGLGATVRSATPLDDGAYFRFPASVRHRYDAMRAFPDGLLVTGDAVCSFNPVFGQGMTVAALEALALRDCLRDTGRRRGLADRYFAAIRPIIDGAWQTSVSADQQIPGTPGRVPRGARLINRYVARFQRAAHSDQGLAVAFLRVMNLMEPPASLLRPRYLVKVIARTPASGRAEKPLRDPATNQPAAPTDRPEIRAVRTPERTS
ncbi:FAD-dependent oxidoreductase [Solicola gregarius]|uniref:FAD-dependent monooxygenase n=1 Tax=Solicola gregarius TaxID=2908642 RepID=A0AA46YJQ2_9ACTN|nr:FAD-dependent monooxygenase [Solicola gregarius]UYM04830.1 FAD-dependent monooxygenase [Solicola gregarius]